MKPATKAIHPGFILRVRLKILRVSISEAARALGICRTHFSDVVNGRAGISANIALRLSLSIGGSPEEWLSHQCDYDLQLARERFLGISRQVRKIGGRRDAE